jgi:hypothetical protein
MQKRFGTALVLILIALCLLRLSPVARAVQPAANALAAETNRMKSVLAALKLSAKEQEDYATQLKQIEQSLQAGQRWWGLRQLQQIGLMLVAYQYLQARPEVEKGGLEAFEREWQRLGTELKGKEALLQAAPARRLPLAVKAMIERSLTQVQPLYQSGRLYGQETTLESGLIYLGNAKAQLEFALFCRQLEFTAPSAAPLLRSLAPELNELEKEILQAYRQPGAAAQQNIFNRLNSALKVAQDLEQEKRYGGALLQYLEVCRLLGGLNPPPAESLKPETLNAESEDWRARLSNGKADHSLAQLYWEQAQAALSAAPGANEQQAAVILHQVLPRYFKYITRIKR